MRISKEERIATLKSLAGENDRIWNEVKYVNGFPKLKDVKGAKMDYYVRLLNEIHIQKQPADSLIKNCPQKMKDYWTDNQSYSYNMMRNTINDKYLDTIPFPFKSSTKKGRLDEIHVFLQAHPEMKSGNRDVLRSRFVDYFLIDVQPSEEAFDILEEQINEELKEQKEKNLK
jgi:hypothetical protein